MRIGVNKIDQHKIRRRKGIAALDVATIIVAISILLTSGAKAYTIIKKANRNG